MFLVSNSVPVRSSLLDLLRDNGFYVVKPVTYDQLEKESCFIMSDQAETFVLDLSSLPNSCLEYLRQIRAHNPQCRIIALHTYNQKDMIDAILQAGANNYIPIDRVQEQIHHLLTGPIMVNKT